MLLVKDISFQNTTFRLVDPSYFAIRDHCHLPNQTASWDATAAYFILPNHNLGFIYFVNCTQEIENSKFVLIPCLNRTNSRVYAVKHDFHQVSDLHDSCRLLGCTIADDPFEHVGHAAIMQAIEKGVLVNWTFGEYFNYWPSCSSFTGQYWKYYLLTIPASFFLWWPFNFIIIGAPFILYITFCIKFIVAPLTIYSFLIHKCWRTSSSVSSIEKILRKNELLRIRRYDFIEISIMTHHFREKLGQGGFGSVYRGKLLSGQQVAVKILSNLVADGDDFISEVATIGMIHHTNIVRLIGFCSEGSKRALIYAYMPNGSLDKYIFSSSNHALPMEKRREIAIGIARGIDYLHRGCEVQILHFDIKPHNILLDHDLTPKISDFGLARLYPKDHSFTPLSMARGTIGYIAPELISRTFGVVSYKADVYSFGMLLMEMASGRRNVNNHAENSSQVYYPSWIYDQLNLPEVAHNISNSVENFGETEERLYKVALWCIQMKASNRPTMSRVIEMLQTDGNSLEMPPRPSVTCSPHEFSVRPSEIESCSIELINNF